MAEVGGEGVVFASQTLHTLGAAMGSLPGWGEMSETSAESAILALESGANNVSGREEDSFPVTLQVFFHELSLERTDVDADEPPT